MIFMLGTVATQSAINLNPEGFLGQSLPHWVLATCVVIVFIFLGIIGDVRTNYRKLEKELKVEKEARNTAHDWREKLSAEIRRLRLLISSLSREDILFFLGRKEMEIRSVFRVEDEMQSLGSKDAALEDAVKSLKSQFRSFQEIFKQCGHDVDLTFDEIRKWYLENTTEDEEEDK